VLSELIRFVKVKYILLILSISKEFISYNSNYNNLLFKLDIYFNINTSVALEINTIVTKTISIAIILAFNLLLINILILQISNILIYSTSI